ncbi:unnamed protein product [Effrenium voratum]|nr:unnamed protein product [Effrenium voratum]
MQCSRSITCTDVCKILEEKKDRKEKKEKAKKEPELPVEEAKEADMLVESGKELGQAPDAQESAAEAEDFWREVGLHDEPAEETAAAGNMEEAKDAVDDEPDEGPSVQEQEEEEAKMELDPERPRVLTLKKEEEALLRANGQAQLLLLRRLASDAELLLEDSELRLSSEVPHAARCAELAARALLASSSGDAVYLREMLQATAGAVQDMPQACLLDVPGGVDPKELRRFGDLVAAYLRPKEPIRAKTKLTPAQAALCKQLGLHVGQAVEVRYGEQWFHATVVGFTELGTVQADYFRTDGSLPECAGGEIEVGAIDIRAAQTPRPSRVIDSGKLLIMGERRARLSARLHAAAQAERRAVATGVASSLHTKEQSLAESMLGLPKDGAILDEEMDFSVSCLELPPETATGHGLHRLNQVARVTDAMLEVLPGGRRALLGGDFEERRRARSLLELLPRVGPYGDLASLPTELQDWAVHLRVPNSALRAVRAMQRQAEEETGTLIFWLPPGSSAPRRRELEPLENGAAVEAQYRGSWYKAKVISSSGDSVQISWDYDGSLDEVASDQIRQDGASSRTAWLRSCRVMLALGPERCRLSCTLRAMAAAETACPELWSSEEAQEDAQTELLDGQGEEDFPYSLEVAALEQFDAPWLGAESGVLRTVEVAAPCAMQLVPGKLLLAGTQLDRERAKEYLQWAQESRKDVTNFGLRAGGRLSVMDADMREDVLPVLLPEAQAVWLTLDRIGEIQKETRTLLVFDTGGGSLLAGGRRLLVCGGTELSRSEAAALAREVPSGLAQVAEVQQTAPRRTDPMEVLNTMAWPQCINDWGRLQKVIWAGHPKLKPGWIRVMSKSQKQEYYLRLSDKETTFDISNVLAT